MRIVWRWWRASVLICAALLVCAGCAQSHGSGAPARPAKASPSPVLASPFRVVASYSAAKLGLRNPRWLAIGPDGDFFFTDATQRVSVLSPDLKLVRRWGSPGSAAGHFRFVNGDPSAPWELGANIAVGADGLVAVSDTGNYRVELFDSNGKFLRQLGGFGSGPGKFIGLPGGLVVSDGSVYLVEDSLEGRLTKFAESGELEWTKQPDKTPGHLHLTMIDGHGRLVLVNDDAASVLYVSKDGRRVGGFDASDGPVGCAATVDGLGDMFMVGCGPPDPLYELDVHHHTIAIFPSKVAVLSTPPMAGPDGDYWALTYDHRLLRLHYMPPGS
jgi:hypothetical protein